MSVSGLTTSYVPNTLDGLNIVEADEIYIDGQQIDLSTLVKYTGNTQPLDMGPYAVQSSHVPSAGTDLINFTTLVGAITNQDTTNSTTFLNKITLTPQTVAGPVIFSSGIVEVGPNHQTLITSADVSVSQYFGTITNVGIVYQATTDTASGLPILIAFPITNGKKYRFTIEILIEDPTYGWYVQFEQSDDNVNPVPFGVIGPVSIPLGSTDYLLCDYTFDAVTTGSVIFSTGSDAPTTNDKALKWKNLTVYEMGVSLTNASYPSLTADRVAVLNERKQLVSSGISITKLGYLDNVSSDIQTQLNDKASLTQTNTFTGDNQFQQGDSITTGITSFKNNSNCEANVGYELAFSNQSTTTRRLGRISLLRNTTGTSDYSSKMALDVSTDGALYKRMLTLHPTDGISAGANRITTTYVPTANEDVVNKAYVDGATGGFLPLSGGTMTGNINMGANSVKSSAMPVVDDDLARKKYVDNSIATRVPRTGDTGLIGDYSTSGQLSANSIISATGVVGTFFYSTSSNITYNEFNDKNKWFKIMDVGITTNVFYVEGHITYSESGQHGHIHFIVSGMFNASPCIRIVQSSFYGTPIVEQLRLSTDNSSIYNQGFVEMYLGNFDWSTDNVSIRVFGVNKPPVNSYYGLVSTKTAGTSTGYSYYPVTSNSGFDINGSGYRMVFTNTGNVGINIDPSHRLDVAGIIRAYGNGPGGPSMIFSENASAGDAYAVAHLRNNGGNGCYWFLNSTTRSGDGGANTATLRNDVGRLRLQSLGYGIQIYGNGAVGVEGASPYAIPYGYMARGSLTLGSIDQNYGGGTSYWNSSTAGLLLECQTNTEIAVHDANDRVASLMYFVGDSANVITIGRDMGWGTTQVVVPSSLSCGGQFQVGTGSVRMKMGLKGGTYANYGNIGTWPSNGNGILITQDENQGANTAGGFIGYNGSLYIQSLEPSIQWRNLYIYAGGFFVYYLGSMAAYLSSGGWVNVSDEREKEDIQDIKTSSSLKRVMALRPKHYRRKFHKSDTPVPEEVKQRREIGFLAQEVKETNPHCISGWENEDVKCDEDDGKRLGICYNDYVVHLVGAVQEQQKQIEQSRASLADLKQHVQVLEEREKVWVEHAKQQEEAMAKLRRDVEKMAGLLAQLIPK